MEEPDLPATEGPLAVDPRGLLGAAGPVGGAAGVGFGRDIVESCGVFE